MKFDLVSEAMSALDIAPLRLHVEIDGLIDLLASLLARESFSGCLDVQDFKGHLISKIAENYERDVTVEGAPILRADYGGVTWEYRPTRLDGPRFGIYHRQAFYPVDCLAGVGAILSGRVV